MGERAYQEQAISPIPGHIPKFSLPNLIGIQSYGCSGISMEVDRIIGVVDIILD